MVEFISLAKETCHGLSKVEVELYFVTVCHCIPVTYLNTNTESSSGKPNMHDVRFVNLSYVSDINVVKEAVDQPHQLTNLNTQKVGIAAFV